MGIEYYKSLPQKRMSAGALFLNRENKVLLVKPTYKKHWDIPGGVIEQNESPLTACKREVIEELSLDVKIIRLLMVDYKESGQEYTESLAFIFFGGILLETDIKKIKLPPNELERYIFIKTDELPEYLNGNMTKRISLWKYYSKDCFNICRSWTYYFIY